MIIGGLQKFSLIDYPHKISAIIFTIGCNFRCPFCHNPELVNPKLYPEKIPEKDVFEFLKNRIEKLDAVVITGGEPSLHKDLYQFISKIKSMGFLVKLDTNGTNPHILKRLINDNLLDYIAMDVKSSFDRYDEVVGTKVDLEKIKESIEIILNLEKTVSKKEINAKDILSEKIYTESPDKKISTETKVNIDKKVEYEFRTTILPRYHNEDEIHKIGKLVAGAKLFILQKFRPKKTLDLEFLKESQFSNNQMLKFKKILENYVQKCLIR
jgi:pyruvate formate lyase activating enzyme